MKHKIYNKHLLLKERNIIEQCLNEGKNFTEISYRVFKDPSTISKKIPLLSLKKLKKDGVK